MLDIDTITKTFAGAPAVREATFTVQRGELVCLLGPSGCGKSTLLRVISGLTDADSGQIRIEGADVTAMQANRRPTAMVFQSHALWSHMTVAQNVGFGLRVRGMPRAQIAAKSPMCWIWWACPRLENACPPSCRADRRSAWPWRGVWLWNQRSF